MDLNITINEGKLSTNLYNEMDAFYFSIMRLPYKYNNIPSKMFYSTFSADILRICKATSSYKYFIPCGHRHISPIMEKGAEINIIKALRKIIFQHIIKALHKIIFQHTEDLLKFNIKKEDIIKTITSYIFVAEV